MKTKIVIILIGVVTIGGCWPQNKTMKKKDIDWLQSFQDIKERKSIKAEFTDDFDEFENRLIECTLEGRPLSEYVSLINKLSNKNVYCLRGGSTIIYFNDHTAIHLITNLDDEKGIIIMEDPQGNTRESRDCYLFLRNIFPEPESKTSQPFVIPEGGFK